MNNEYWGYHMLIDGCGADLDAIKNPNVHRAFLKQLIKDIDMVAYGEPVIEHFATHDPEKAGYSIVQLIETSNITAHFVDKDGSFYLDVFSCKPYNPDDVVKCVRRFYNNTNEQINMIHRRAPRF